MLQVVGDEKRRTTRRQSIDIAVSLDLAEILKDGVDHLKGLVDLFSDLGASENDLAAHEDEEHNLGLDHAVDETGEQFRLVRAEVVMLGSETLETDGELDVARADNVLDLEIRELGVEAELLNDAGVLARGEFRVVFRLGTRDNHLAAREDQSRGLGLTNSHDDGSETLGVVLGVPRMQGNRLEIKTTVKIDCRDDVLEGGRQATASWSRARSRSRSRGSHPSTICGLTTLLTTVCHEALVGGIARRCELVDSAGEGQGARSREGLGLRRVGGVGLNALHIRDLSLRFLMKFSLLKRIRCGR